MDDEPLELEDILSNIDNKERCARLIGHAIHEAYTRDEDFRATLRPLLHHLAKKSQSFDPTKYFFYNDALNHYLISAFHASRAAELLFKYVQEYRDDRYPVLKLISVHHAFGPNAVFCLASARSLMTMDIVVQSFETVSADSIERAFDKWFPRLTEARNSLAHQDERAMVVFKGKLIDGRDPFEHRQSDGQAGTRIFGLMDKDQKQFELDVSSQNIMGLASALVSVFDIQ